MPSLINEKNISSLAINFELYDRILNYSIHNGLITSTYNHGHGVYRKYTLAYCLQKTGNNMDFKYYLKRNGRFPSKNSGVKKDIETLQIDTPEFDALCRNIARKYAKHVRFVKRYLDYD